MITTNDDIYRFDPDRPPDGYADMLTANEVARIFRVNLKTVGRWERTGRVRCIRTIGGHRRFLRADIDAYLRGQGVA